MKKETIITTPTYYPIGLLFGKKWLADQNDSKLDGFNPDAEGYWSTLRSRTIMARIANILLLPMAGFWVWFPLEKNSDAIPVIILTLVIFLFSQNKKIFPIGKTRTELALAWAPVRKILEKNRILLKVHAEMHDKEEPFFNGFTDHNLFMGAVNRSMKSLYNSLRTAEREGADTKAERIKSKMRELNDLISDDFGILMDWPSDYFGR